MGYTTDFNGSLNIEPKLTEEQAAFINTFSSTRRVKRNSTKLMEKYNGQHGLPGAPAENPYGKFGEYFAKDDGNFGQNNDGTVTDGNTPPAQQPTLWCQWIINEDGDLEWDQNEKFYGYTEWLKYMIEHFFKPWGVTLNGEIEWRGEEWGDTGTIIVKDNVVTTLEN